jgi:hypothetical protein
MSLAPPDRLAAAEPAPAKARKVLVARHGVVVRVTH